MDLKHGINIDVTATLSISEETLRTCIDLIAIDLKAKGYAGMLIDVDDYGAPCIRMMQSKNEVDAAWIGVKNVKED